MAEIVDADYIKQRQVGTSSEHCVRRGDDIVALLPAATASADGKMTKEQAQSVANSAVAGSNGQVQFSDNAALAASSDFTWDKINKKLYVKSNTTAAPIIDLRSNTTNTLPAVYLRDSNEALAGSNTTFFGRGDATLPSPGFFYLGALVTQQIAANSLNFGLLLSSVNKGRYESLSILAVNGFTGINKTLPTAQFHVKGSTSDNTDYAVKVDNDSNSNLFYVRNDGQLDSSGSRIIGYGTVLTSDATLTQSSASCAVINPSGAGIVITMHLSPPDGIKQRTVNVSAFSVTLGRNSQKMAGLEANYTLPASTAIDWQYYGAPIGWIPISISTW